LTGENERADNLPYMPWSHWIVSAEKYITGFNWAIISPILSAFAIFIKTAWDWYKSKTTKSDDERRHQDSFAPILEFTYSYIQRFEALENFGIKNIGKGLAFQVHINIDLTTHGKQNTYTNLSPTILAMLATIDMSHPSILTITTMVGGPIAKTKDGWRKKDTQRFELLKTFKFSLASVKCDSEAILFGNNELDSFRHDNDIQGIDKLEFKIHVTYLDMFGNKYETKYPGPGLQDYKWIPPPSLRIRK
jgi:hypothetical protein